MATLPKLTPKTPDSKGFLPDLHLVGQKFKHGNGETYCITAFMWCGDTDEWGVVHTRPGTVVKMVRPASNFFEPGRFERVG